jgi:hypothetical protein
MNELNTKLSPEYRRQRIFIYERKEIFVLMGLVLMVALFAFTLGVHLGKKVGGVSLDDSLNEVGLVQPSADAVPGRYELAEQITGVKEDVDEAIKKNLHHEVARTGIRVDQQYQLDLPDETTGVSGVDTATGRVTRRIRALERRNPRGSFTLQVGSFQSLGDAADRSEALEALDLEPFIRRVELDDKGIWFRVYLEGFDTRDAAERFGKRYQDQRVIESYLISAMPES